MEKDRQPHILSRLKIGFRTDSMQLKELEKELAVLLKCAMHFGKKHGSPDKWNTIWHQHWENVEGILCRIILLVREMEDSIGGSESDRLQRALAAWETFQSEDSRLVETLGAIRTQAIGLDAVVRKDWNMLARPLESHLETIYACAQALRIKLEWLKKHSREEVNQIVQSILSKVPNRAHADSMDAEEYDQEIRKATAELEKEHHQCLGFMDVVKGLWLWVETKEERVIKNRSLRVDEA